MIVIRHKPEFVNLRTAFKTIYFHIDRRNILQKFFPTFLDGLPGIALLILRAAIGITIIFHAGKILIEPRDGNSIFIFLIIGLLEFISGIFLLVGLLTPLFALLGLFTAIVTVFTAFSSFAFDSSASVLSFFYFSIISIAVVLLGPGAFSIDARMFGRREIIIPQKSDRSNF